MLHKRSKRQTLPWRPVKMCKCLFCFCSLVGFVHLLYLKNLTRRVLYGYGFKQVFTFENNCVEKKDMIINWIWILFLSFKHSYGLFDCTIYFYRNFVDITIPFYFFSLVNRAITISLLWILFLHILSIVMIVVIL